MPLMVISHDAVIQSIDSTIDNTFTCVGIEHTLSLECIRYGSIQWYEWVDEWVNLTSLQSFKPSNPKSSIHPIPYHIYGTAHTYLWSRKKPKQQQLSFLSPSTSQLLGDTIYRCLKACPGPPKCNK